MSLSDLLIYSGSIPTELILWSFYIAIVIGSIVMYLTKVKFGKIVYALLEKGAVSPETALTLEEIGIKPSFFILFNLKNHLNYKDLLVAITTDGKYYANAKYSDQAPQFKQLVAITRKKRSRITETKTEATDIETDANIPESPTVNEVPDNTESDSINNTTAPDINPYQKPERVKFNVQTAKYYIPEAIHPKVRSLYNDKSIKPWVLILILIGLGILIYFAGFIANELIDMFNAIGKD